ncbi:putative reverse transcriptase domain-containing protein [Tanacetum coccineum]
MATNRQSNSGNDENPDIAAIIAQQMQNIIPHIVTQVTNNMNNNNNDNNANNGNGGNNGCSYKTLLACNHPEGLYGKDGLDLVEHPDSSKGCEAALEMTWVEFKALLMEEFVQAGILTDEAVRCGTLTRSSEKRKDVEKQTPPRNENVGSYLKCAKYSAYHPESGPCRLCFNCQKPGHFARVCWELVKQVAPVSAVRIENNQRVSVFIEKWSIGIQLEGSGEILCVQGERTLRGTKTLMSTKAEELELSDIPIVRDFTDVFSEDLSGLPPSPVLWAEIGESRLIGPELVQETTDKIILIKEKLKSVRDRQKSYDDNRSKPLEG